MSEINDLQNMPDAPVSQPQAQSLTLGDSTQVARASAGLALQEAVNLGEINPAMARRFGERMDQLFKALMGGAGVQWDQTNGALKIVYPEVVNPLLAAAQERKAKRALQETTVIPHDTGLRDYGEPE